MSDEKPRRSELGPLIATRCCLELEELRREVLSLRQALEKIVRWDDAEKPHRNLPLLDCADLARAVLSHTPQEDTARGAK